jgi:TonB-dependent SusC/RagA subfamily outer membrane receptor
MAFSNPENIVKPVFQSAKQLAAGLHVADAQLQVAAPDTITVTVKKSVNAKQPGSKTDTLVEKTENIKTIYIVDGVEKTDFNEKEISPETIETVNIYKGDKATELYGEKGKNGVVVVSTKKIVKQSGSDKTEIIINSSESNLDKAYVVVDGVHDPDFIKNNKNPENIESIDILKGESATALYGEKGKNGVIIITLKKKK